MKYFILIILLVQSDFIFSQNISKHGLQMIDISQKEIRLINTYKHEDSLVRSKIFADSLYKPYESFWQGYIGKESNFIKWINIEVLPNLLKYNTKNEQVDGEKLVPQFNRVKSRMEKITGYSPAGTWYILYGPGWTDLGGLSGGTMLIDLSHKNNSSNQNIVMSFPHEITHQIYGNVTKYKDNTALGSIIGEGFAVFMNKLYWKNKYSLAANLGFSEAQLVECEKEEKEIRLFFEKNKLSTDKETIDKFRRRNYHLKENLPGAIGYYIGYRIIEKYVKRHGRNSWKDVFKKSPQQIYNLSGY